VLIDDSFFYLHADPEHFEPLERYRAQAADFLEPVRRILPGDWRLERKSIWIHASPPGADLPAQGWKIHLSATLASSPAILTTAARLLARGNVPFKFSADKTILLLINGKRWSRGGAGKFITIYPRDQRQCGELLESLHQALIGYHGPYILSDRRYRDSGVVFYRYGGILPTRRLDVDGKAVPVMQSQDGQIMDDERTPFFNMPTGMTDPFATASDSDPDGEATLKHGRYRVESVISFSNPGGVYVALDQETGRKVLIKEARPYTNVSPRGTDAVWLLKKEHRLLTLLADTAVAPQPLDFFKDWEHYYLVEELIDGRVLRGFMAQHTPGLRTRLTPDYARDFFARYRKLFVRIAEILALLHERRIVFSDLSHYNVMVLEDEDVRLIDFEGAYEQGIDVPTVLYTPGFAPLQVIEEGTAQPEDDYFALGGLMLAGLIPVNSLLALNPRAHEPFLRAMTQDLGLPPTLSETIQDLLVQDRSRRPQLSRVLEVLATDHPLAPPEPPPATAWREECEELLDRTLDYIETMADVSRRDRLFPADPLVFTTNPLSLAHGACGVAHVLQRIRGRVDPRVLDWILGQKITAEDYPPGLYMGLAGIAWCLLELGQRERAEDVMRIAGDHPLVWRSPDLFHGAAGSGMAQLRFFLATGDEEYLARAEAAGRFLVDSRQEEEGQCWWPAQGDLCCGLAHGGSGVSLFLLYLFLITGREELLSVGHKGMQHVAARALRNPDGGLTWRAKEGELTYTPYWRWGSAGIGMVLLRYAQVLRDPGYGMSLLEGLLVDADRKYTLFPGRFFGLAGIGELHLDVAHLGRDREQALAGARKALAGIQLFQLERDAGIAFPGETLARISCDYGTGSAGIVLFLHRLLHGGQPAFMLDELLERRSGKSPGPGGLTLAV
jgi:serine/threonine protein kinase